jgi:hypothetical protein
MQDKSLLKAQEAMIAEINPFEARSHELLVSAEAQEVTSELQLRSAVAIKKQITAHRKLVSDTRLSITRRFDDIKKAIMNRESEIVLPLDKAQSNIGEKILTYQEEQEHIRIAEAQRVSDLVDSVSIEDAYKFKTPDDVATEGARLKTVYSEMSVDDQKNGDVKLAFTQSVNRLADRKAYLEEEIKQEAEHARLAEEAKKQSAERAAIEAEKAAVEAKERKIAAEKERLEREKQRRLDEEKAEADRHQREYEERTRVKTGARTVMSFEVTNPELVPREYCTPNDALIRAALKDGKEVPGVEVTVSKKI